MNSVVQGKWGRPSKGLAMAFKNKRSGKKVQELEK